MITRLIQRALFRKVGINSGYIFDFMNSEKYVIQTGIYNEDNQIT